MITFNPIHSNADLLKSNSKNGCPNSESYFLSEAIRFQSKSRMNFNISEIKPLRKKTPFAKSQQKNIERIIKNKK